METVSSPEEQVLAIYPQSAHSPRENSDVRRKRRFSTSFLRKQESSRPAGECRVRCCAAGRDLDPCFRRGDGGGGHTGILQACRRTRKRHFLTSFLRKQESSRTLDPCFRRGGGGRGSQTTRLTKTLCAGRIKCDCPGGAKEAPAPGLGYNGVEPPARDDLPP